MQTPRGGGRLAHGGPAGHPCTEPALRHTARPWGWTLSVNLLLHSVADVRRDFLGKPGFCSIFVILGSKLPALVYLWELKETCSQCPVSCDFPIAGQQGDTADEGVSAGSGAAVQQS